MTRQWTMRTKMTRSTATIELRRQEGWLRITIGYSMVEQKLGTLLSNN